MTQRELKALYNYKLNVEAATDAVTARPFTDAFKTVWSFIAAVRRYKRTLIAPLKWRKVTMKISGRQYTVFFRDALRAAQDEVLSAQFEDLNWGPSSSTEHDAGSMDASTDASTTARDTVLRNAWDTEIYKRQKEHVDGTLHPGTRVLGFYVYSDSTVLSSSGAVSAYPLRMRVININTDEVRWVTLAYIPQVEAKILETIKGREVHGELLQRILHVANVLMGDFRGAGAMRTEAEMEHSLNRMVPALAAWAGLDNGPRMLYRLPGVDRRHVCFYAM